MSTRRNERLKAAAKAVVTVVILALVLRKVPFADLSARLARLSFADVSLLVVLTGLQVTIGVVRWQRLLARVGERVAFFPLYGDVLVGLMYNMFLPTTVGGDVVRALRARRRVKAPHHAWSTSIYERIAGLLAMAASAAFAVTLGVGSSTQIPPAVRWVAFGIAATFLIVFFVAAAPFRLLVKLVERRLPNAARDVQGIVEDLEGPLASTGARLEALGWSALYQAIGIAFVIVGARGLGAPGHALAIAIGVPLVHVLSMLPITIGGLGLREGLFVAVLRPLGVAGDVALGLAAQWLASSVAFAIGGAIVALFDPSPAPSEAAPEA